MRVGKSLRFEQDQLRGRRDAKSVKYRSNKIKVHGISG
jgi:hypothetical protein